MNFGKFLIFLLLGTPLTLKSHDTDSTSVSPILLLEASKNATELLTEAQPKTGSTALRLRHRSGNMKLQNVVMLSELQQFANALVQEIEESCAEDHHCDVHSPKNLGQHLRTFFFNQTYNTIDHTARGFAIAEKHRKGTIGRVDKRFGTLSTIALISLQVVWETIESKILIGFHAFCHVFNVALLGAFLEYKKIWSFSRYKLGKHSRLKVFGKYLGHGVLSLSTWPVRVLKKTSISIEGAKAKIRAWTWKGLAKKSLKPKELPSPLTAFPLALALSSPALSRQTDSIKNSGLKNNLLEIFNPELSIKEKKWLLNFFGSTTRIPIKFFQNIFDQFYDFSILENKWHNPFWTAPISTSKKAVTFYRQYRYPSPYSSHLATLGLFESILDELERQILFLTLAGGDNSALIPYFEQQYLKYFELWQQFTSQSEEFITRTIAHQRSENFDLFLFVNIQNAFAQWALDRLRFRDINSLEAKLLVKDLDRQVDQAIGRLNFILGFKGELLDSEAELLSQLEAIEQLLHGGSYNDLIAWNRGYSPQVLPNLPSTMEFNNSDFQKELKAFKKNLVKASRGKCEMALKKAS